MRILFITVAFAPNEFSESIVNSKLVLAFKAAGHQVDVISRGNIGLTYSSSWTEPWYSLEADTSQIDYELGSKVHRIVDYLLSSIQFLYPLEGIRWIRRAYLKGEQLIQTKTYDIIMTRSPSDIPHVVGLALKRKYKIPWIANWNDPSNGIIPEPYKNNPNKITNYISRYFTQKELNKADFVTFPCERLRGRFVEYFDVSTEKSAIIPHIGLSLINSVPKPYSYDTLTICHAGSLSEERNPEVLFRNIARINKESGKSIIRLTIIGIADPQIMKLIEKYSIEQEVRIIKGKSYFETLTFMAEYDILCVIEARMKDGIYLPSKLSDYVYLKKPILCVSPSNGTLVDIINEYGGGLVVNNDLDESVYQGLCELLNSKKDNTLMKKFYSPKLAHYLSRYKILNEYDTIFNNLLGN
ncbi:MAG TPA: hypothetical protein DDW27_08280 [Bacteroidales bacterium]|nr:hypothetical protein [Bacteroidales bacterium]